MTTRHTPATPPWLAKHNEMERRANAYPKLVEALRCLKKDADQQCKDEGWPTLDTSHDANALLRELGEE